MAAGLITAGREAAAQGPAPAGRVYLYSRFSSALQADGGSQRRQTAKARKWVREHGMTLDETLHLHDVAKSEFKGRTVVKDGVIGKFLQEVKAGNVPVGSVLLCESLGRVSRENMLSAHQQFREIVESGIDIVTLRDGVRYNREQLERDASHLFLAMAVMMHTRDESARKSEVYQQKCERWRRGERGFLIGAPRAYSEKHGKVVGTDPVWVLYDREANHYELVPEKVEAIHQMLHWYREGHGAVEIARRLRDTGLSISEDFPVARVQRLVDNPALKGVRVITVNGERYELNDYYPRVLTDREWNALQILSARRGRVKADGGVPSILTGMSLAFCGHCRAPLFTQNLKRTNIRVDDTEKYIRRLRCGAYYAKGTKCSGGVESCSAEPVERALLQFCSQQANLDAVFPAAKGRRQSAKKLKTARAKVVRLKRKLASFEKDWEKADEPPSEAEKKIVRKAEVELRNALAQAAQFEREFMNKHHKPSTAEQWRDLVVDVLALDYDARVKCRTQVADTFTAVRVYMSDRKVLGIELESKHGVKRHLLADRRTGDVIAIVERGM